MIEEFESEMEVEEDRNRRRREKTAKIFKNAKVWPQDEVYWDEGKQETELCPLCGHYFTMTTETMNVVNAENEVVKVAHSEEIRQFERLPVAQKKDRKRPVIEDSIALGLDTGNAKEMMIAVLRNRLDNFFI